MYLLLTLFLLFLLFPETTSAGTKNGIQLLINQVIPALYPFIFLTAILKNITHQKTTALKFLLPLAFLSGYPLGAKIVAQNIQAPTKVKQILLFLCNNPSPAYMLSFVGFQCLNRPQKGIMIYTAALIGSTIWALIRYLINRHQTDKAPSGFLQSCGETSGTLDTVVDQTFTSLLHISGYLMFFCCISAFIVKIPFLSPVLQSLFAGFLEMTTGIQNLKSIACSEALKMILITGMVSFGGISVIAQTQSMINGSGLSIKKYMTDKAISSVIAMSVMYLFTHIC